MWAKNGSKTLAPVLNRINHVIPEDQVQKRVLIDDRSDDDTREIAENLGWKVFLNEGKGISSGANTALRQVTSDYFVSFEQDLLLAKEWWHKIPILLEDEAVAVASGVRIPQQPQALKKLQEYTFEHYQQVERRKTDLLYGKTIDNTIYKTEVIRKLGGFPTLPVSVGVDHFLAKNVISAGFKWKVDYTVRSFHLRGGIRDELTHYYWYGANQRRLSHMLYGAPLNLGHNIFRFLISPVRGLQVSLEKRVPQVVYIYPLIRFNILKGMLEMKETY